MEYRNSKSLEQLVQLMLKYSNNFIANQTGLAISANSLNSQPASLSQSIDKVQSILNRDYDLDESQITIEEFSGISRNNSITADAMMTILDEFKEYAHLLDRKGTALVKSGTLDGIYNYAGYLQINQQAMANTYSDLLNNKRA